MKNNKFLFLVIDFVILLAAWGAILLLGREFGLLLWSAFLFTGIAFIVQIPVIRYFMPDSLQGEGYFYNLPVIYSAMLYLVLQAAAGVCFSVFPIVSARVGIFVQILLAAVFLIRIVLAMASKNHLQAVSQAKDGKAGFTKVAYQELMAAADRIGDREQRQEVQFLAELAKTGNPCADWRLADVEQEILHKIKAVREQAAKQENAVSDIAELKRLLEERDRRAKAL